MCSQRRARSEIYDLRRPSGNGLLFKGGADCGQPQTREVARLRHREREAGVTLSALNTCHEKQASIAVLTPQIAPSPPQPPQPRT